MIENANRIVTLCCVSKKTFNRLAKGDKAKSGHVGQTFAGSKSECVGSVSSNMRVGHRSPGDT